MRASPTPVVTCTIYNDGAFLVIRRHDKAKKFGALWGFPGGKVEEAETIAGALRREIEEETNLQLTDKLLFIDSYYYGNSIGFHFAGFSDSREVTSEEGVEHRWLKSLKDLQQLKRIPGIDFHVIKASELLSQEHPFLSINAIDYIPEKYVN